MGFLTPWGGVLEGDSGRRRAMPNASRSSSPSHVFGGEKESRNVQRTIRGDDYDDDDDGGGGGVPSLGRESMVRGLEKGKGVGRTSGEPRERFR